MFGPGNVENLNADITANLPHVDFTQPHLCERTVPVFCSICGDIISIFGRHNWSRLLVAITEMFITKNNPKLESLYHQSLNSRSDHSFFMDSMLDHHNCARLSNGKWIDLNYSIPRLIDIIGKLCVFCGVGLEDVQIYYMKKGITELQDAAASAQQSNIVVDNEISVTETTSRLTIREAIIKVLQASQQGMTVKEIYDKIIENRLYSFGAQNPLNVVRNQILSACEGSNFRYRSPKNYFRCAIDVKGKKREKIYFLLLKSLTNEVAQPSFVVNVESTTLGKEAKNELSNSNIENIKSQIITEDELNDIVDLDDGIRGIRKILNAHFLTLYGYSNIIILWDAVQNSLPMFLNDNAINSANDLWRFLVCAFKNEFIFRSPHIWQNIPNYPQSSRGLIINLSRQYGGIVTREQIDSFFSRIKLTSLFNSFVLDKGQLLFYDNAKFILTEIVNPTAERCSLISKALDKLFSCENIPFIVLRDISSSWFSRLPELSNGLQWTCLLLQELLRICPDIGYRIISSDLKGQAIDMIGAAIVPSESEIETFADVVHRFCYGKYKLPIKLSAEELRLELRGAGMLDGNELIYNMHKALKDYRFAFSDENRTVMILER